MLKKRIIPVQLLHGNRLVKTVSFGEYRDVGDPVKSSSVYSSQQADELVFLNIHRDERSVHSFKELIEHVSEECFMPLAMGGGVKTLEDAIFLIRNGADKVVVNSAIYDDPSILSRIADRFGSQAVIASIDVRWNEVESRYIAASDCGRHPQSEWQMEALVQQCEEMGAGELLIQSIDRDGGMQGFDLALFSLVTANTSLPVIGGGGSGNYGHLLDAFQTGDVDAVACGSIFNFSDSNPIRAKAFLSNYDVPVKVV